MCENGAMANAAHRKSQNREASMDCDLKDVYFHSFPTAYPKEDATHMVLRRKKHDYVYDRNFMYRLCGFRNMLLRYLLYFSMVIFVQPLCKVRYALRIRGRKNIRKYRSMTDKKGMISVCNHSVEWDPIITSMARYFHFAEFPVWQEGAESSSGTVYRLFGGIPIAKNNPKALVLAYQAMKNVVEEGKWLHVFPEAACWPFYPAIRNFQSGTFRIAVETGMPVLPMAVKHRESRGIYKLFKKQPNAELRIGEPVLPDLSLPKKEATEDLCNRTRCAVMALLGIDSEEKNTQIRNHFPTY